MLFRNSLVTNSRSRLNSLSNNWTPKLGRSIRCSANIYSPALHGKRQGSICHDDRWAYRPFIVSWYLLGGWYGSVVVWREICFTSMKLLWISSLVICKYYCDDCTFINRFTRCTVLTVKLGLTLQFFLGVWLFLQKKIVNLQREIKTWRINNIKMNLWRKSRW